MVKNLPANPGDAVGTGSIPESVRSLEEEMATHLSILAWEIPWTEEPGGLQSIESQRVRQDCATEYTGQVRCRQCLESLLLFTESGVKTSHKESV